MSLGELIRRHKLTKGFCEQEISALAKLAAKVEFDEGTLILKEGQLSEPFLSAACGQRGCRAADPAVQHLRTGSRPGRGFGWSAVLDHHEILFQIRAREPISAVRIFGQRLDRVVPQSQPAWNGAAPTHVMPGRPGFKATERRFAEMCGVRLASAAD